MTDIQLHNTKTRRKEVFAPIDDKNVRMYVCGPTVYDRAHIGNARPVLVFDVLFRLLRHVYGADHVTYVRNFTDVDDKINATALARQQAGAQGSLEDLISERTEETIDWYLKDMGALGALEPTHAPRATQYIQPMIDMIKTLIREGYAYSKPITYGHNSKAVYFNAEKAPEHSFFKVDENEEYGGLSGRSLDEMIAGSRSEVGEGKANPMDFVLWKPSNMNEPGWVSPWGFGRPGWHIECSAMAKELLGDTFDIHGGGLDLQFPHHENEIAQSCCANKTEFMANVWMHNEMLQVEGKKMSKSLGNFFTVRDLLDDGVPGEVIRFVMLSTHYRKPMDWTEKKREDAEKTLKKWYRATASSPTSGDVTHVVDKLFDDLNTHEALNMCHHHYSEGDTKSLRASMAFLGFWGSGLPDWVIGSQYDLSAISDALDKARAAAVASKDFTAVDRIKTILIAAGVEVQMSREGVRLSPTPNFDPAKLDALK
jgi:cysteinyl-tRNA synthetase